MPPTSAAAAMRRGLPESIDCRKPGGAHDIRRKSGVSARRVWARAGPSTLAYAGSIAAIGASAWAAGT
jgi:hypothetical protein